MIIVTGTKRSGTSLWMRMLVEGGLDHIGERFPSTWGESIREANPNGFYESRLRRGIYFATNPDPRNGRYLRAADTHKVAVKVFIPGVVRTERAYLHRVVATLRTWRSYARSMARLDAHEEAWVAKNPRKGETPEQAVARLRASRSPLPAPIEWFLENYELVRDFAVRRYPIHFVTYERLLADPDATLDKVFDWIGTGDPGPAKGVIDPALRRSPSMKPVPSEASVGTEEIRLFDAFYEAIHESSSIPKSLVEPLNATWKRLSEAHGRKDTRERAARDEVPELDPPPPSAA